MDKPSNINISQKAWIERGLSEEQATKIEQKIAKGKKGVLKGAAGERFISELKKNENLVQKYAESEEIYPSKFLKLVMVDAQELRSNAEEVKKQFMMCKKKSRI